MYNSPVELLVDDIQHQIVKKQDEEIYKAVLHYIPNVNKEELIRALKYDRNQYETGYMDGKADAMAEIVRCKDCNNFVPESITVCRHCSLTGVQVVDEDEFCSYGERRTDEASR